MSVKCLVADGERVLVDLVGRIGCYPSAIHRHVTFIGQWSAYSVKPMLRRYPRLLEPTDEAKRNTALGRQDLYAIVQGK